MDLDQVPKHECQALPSTPSTCAEQSSIAPIALGPAARNRSPLPLLRQAWLEDGPDALRFSPRSVLDVTSLSMSWAQEGLGA